MIMNEKLKAAIDFFALMIPECKIGIYSNNPLDDKRLDKIAFLSDLLNICKHPTKCILWRAAMLATFA